MAIGEKRRVSARGSGPGPHRFGVSTRRGSWSYQTLPFTAPIGAQSDMRAQQMAQLELANPTYTAIIGPGAQLALQEMSGSAPAPH